MTVSRKPDRLIHAFLQEGEEQLNDQVFDTVRAAIGQKRQRAVIGPWRTPSMNRFVTYGLAAAAVLVIALLVGSRLFGSPSVGAGSQATPMPTPTATPTPTPTPTPTSDLEGRLPVGPHRLLADPAAGPTVTINIAAPDWHGIPLQGFVQWGPTGADGPTGAGMIGFGEGEYYVYGDPCHWSTTTPDTPAKTVDELMRALANQDLRKASAPENITVDGYAGKKVILRMAARITDFDACDKSGGDGTFGLFGVASSVDGPARYSQDPGQIEEVWAVNMDGRLVVNIGVYYPDTPQHAIDEVRAILATATFDKS